MNDQLNKNHKSELWESIYVIVSKLKLAETNEDAYDKPSITTELERLFNTRQPELISDDLDKICTREWKLGYQYANWEWREKIQKQVNEIMSMDAGKHYDYQSALTILYQLLSDQPDKSPDADGWVSVEERLPEEGEWVLGYCLSAMEDWQYFTVFLSGGMWYDDSEDDRIVDFWQPLPTPPKQQKP